MTSVIITIPARSGLTASGLSGGTHEERWDKTAFFCPGCGKHSVWVATNGGDYYVGEMHICVDCRSRFYLPCDVEPIKPDDFGDSSRADALIESVKAQACDCWICKAANLR